jgi:hypothetical protein
VAGAKATQRKESGIAFSIRRMKTIAQTIAQTRKDSRLSSRRRKKKKREYARSTILPWRGKTQISPQFQPPHFPPHVDDEPNFGSGRDAEPTM